MARSPVQAPPGSPGLTPAFVARVPNARSHGDYLEAAHETIHANLWRIHFLLAKGEYETATEMVSKLRAHLDTLWDQRREVAQRGVRP